jgi:hypothetical protein
MSDYENPTAEALELWMDIIGTRPDATSLAFGQLHHRTEFNEIREALELDPSEITANLLLGFYAREHFKNTHVTQAQLLEDTDGILALLEKPRRLMAILERPEIVGRRDQFVANVAMALDQYGAGDREDVKKLLANNDTMAWLRRDALRSMANLSVHQFLDGDPEPDDVRPVYYRFVHQWFNVNTMLDSVAGQAPGVSLNLIRDPNDYQSYFCFAIRNGGRLFVLSDVPNNAHPMQPMLSRRPDRDMDRRIARNWFPYDLMGLAYHEETGRLYFDRSEEKALVVGQSKALPLKPISQLGPHETVWTAMMFGLVVDRFWRRGHTEKELSYTAEMVRVEDRMIAAAAKSGLPVKGYTPIDLKPLTLEDVKGKDGGNDGAYGKCEGDNHAWLEGRYGHLVSAETLNVIASPERHHVLSIGSGEMKDQRHRHEAPTFFRDDRSVSVVNVEKLPSTFFGTKEKLEADRRFIARYNYAIQIGALARNEFEKRKDEVRKWYRGMVDANLETLKTWVQDGVLWIESEGIDSRFAGTRYHPFNDGGRRKDRCIRSFSTPWDLESSYQTSLQLGYGAYYLGGWDSRRGSLCLVNGTKATIGFVFCPVNAVEIAVVAGCTVDDLPDVLRYYNLETIHVGNQILERVDPMQWAVTDPWEDLDMRVGFFLSKRGFKKLCDGGVRPPYWEERGYKGVYDLDWRR